MSEQASERMSAVERVSEMSSVEQASESALSGAGEQAHGRASGPVFMSRFLAILPHCADFGSFFLS